MVSGTLIDLLSLGTLTWLTRRDGLRLADLLDVRGERLGRDVVLALGDLAAMAPAVGISAVLTRLFYGSSGQPPQVAVARGLPRTASAYSVLVWPVIWSVTEEATYLGYTLQRVEALTGNTPYQPRWSPLCGRCSTRRCPCCLMGAISSTGCSRRSRSRSPRPCSTCSRAGDSRR